MDYVYLMTVCSCEEKGRMIRRIFRNRDDASMVTRLYFSRIDVEMTDGDRHMFFAGADDYEKPIRIFINRKLVE